MPLTRDHSEPQSKDKIDDKTFRSSGDLQVKIYKPRNSLLTNLLEEDEHLQSVYCAAIALFIGTLASTAFTDYVNEGRIYLGSRTIIIAFRNISWAFLLWIPIFLSSIVVYYCFILWTNVRKQLTNKRKLWDLIWLTLFASYYPGLIFFASKAAISYDLGIASSIALLMETIRFLMKTHAFVRTNCSKHLQQKDKNLCPTFSHYLYFSFAPVLVYKDAYPKSNAPIRWRFVGKCVIEFVLGLWFFSIIFEQKIAFGLSDYGIKTYTWIDIVIAILRNYYAGVILDLLIFYCGFHVLLNGTAELSGFSDRLFYQDWWTADTPERSIRKWNFVVQDWLYMYIYKDFYENVFPRKRTLAKFMVFLISALFHDYIICVSARLFVPITTVTFLIPAVSLQFPYKNKNVFVIVFWLGFGLGISTILTILNMEYFAQINCTLQHDSLLNIIKPKFLYC